MDKGVIFLYFRGPRLYMSKICLCLASKHLEIWRFEYFVLKLKSAELKHILQDEVLTQNLLFRAETFWAVRSSPELSVCKKGWTWIAFAVKLDISPRGQKTC